MLFGFCCCFASQMPEVADSFSDLSPTFFFSSPPGLLGWKAKLRRVVVGGGRWWGSSLSAPWSVWAPSLRSVFRAGNRRSR